MEHDGDSQPPPFWYQPPTNPRLRLPPSRLINQVALPFLALLVFYLLFPQFLSHTKQILRPNSVKRSWDSLNMLLVLFAVLCGVFSRRNDEPPPAENDSKLRHSVPTWLDFPDRKGYSDTNNITGDVSSGIGRLRRSSSSYPDLRQESIWETGGGNRARFMDDFEVDIYRSPSPPEGFHSLPNRPRTEIPDDKFEVRSAELPTPSTPPPPPPPPKRRRSVHSVPRRENSGRRRDEAEVNIMSEEPRPALTPPSPQLESQSPVEEMSGKVHRKKSGGPTKEIATALASLYRDQRKRKKRGIKSRNVYESAGQNSVQNPQSVPPPPSSKLLQNLFKKSGKGKRVHSVPTSSPPPPPPPPPNSILVNLFKSKRFQPSSSSVPPPPPVPPPTSLKLNSQFKKGSINSRRFINAITSPPPPPPPPRQPQLTTGKPPKPFKQAPTSHEKDIKIFIAPPSPLIPLPPPPPPPQFRMAKARFVARGDFVRIRSTHSSRCSSPELEDVEVDVDSSVKADCGPSISCPSPDVNVKADTFIARLRDEWRLEKVNSVNEKRVSG